MKQLLLAVLILTFFEAIGQTKKQGGYFSARGGAAFKDDYSKGLAHISVGVSPNHTFGVGLGVGYIKFDKSYIPLTVDISFFGKPGKVSPVAIGSAGYGIYEYVTPFAKIKGGFAGSLNAGISFPVKNYTKVFLTGGYSIYSFNGGKNVVTSGDSYYSESSIKMFTVTAGIKI